VFEIDEFDGDNAGLIVAEVELGAADEEFTRPAWLGREVSDDSRYYNVNLARRPFRSWETS
jgi:adenylate cyclase